MAYSGGAMNIKDEQKLLEERGNAATSSVHYLCGLFLRYVYARYEIRQCLDYFTLLEICIPTVRSKGQITSGLPGEMALHTTRNVSYVHINISSEHQKYFLLPPEDNINILMCTNSLPCSYSAFLTSMFFHGI